MSGGLIIPDKETAKARQELFGISEQLDTISRRSVIKEIDELLQTAKGESEHDLKMLRRVIKDMLPSAQRWIPCKTALPEKENTRAIIQTNAGTVIIDGVYGGIDVYGHHVWRDKEGGLYWDDEIVAWMPIVIPEPYKEHDDD